MGSQFTKIKYLNLLVKQVTTTLCYASKRINQEVVQSFTFKKRSNVLNRSKDLKTKFGDLVVEFVFETLL